MGGVPYLTENGQFLWNGEREEIALHVAQGKLSWEKIAAEVGVSRGTVWNLYQIPDFKARVDEHKAAFASEIRSRALANHEGRLDSLYKLRERIMRILEEREAAYDDNHTEPGMASGLLNENVTIMQMDGDSGERSRIIKREYKYETALARDLMAIEKQIAQELGQFSEKSEIHVDGPPVREFNIIINSDPTPFDMAALDAAIDAGDEDDV
jgi:hypothetical protein